MRLHTSKPSPLSSPYDTGAYANIRQGERSGTQGRAPWTSTFQSTNKITAEQNTMKDQENTTYATEVCEHSIISLYNNSICQ